MAEAGNQKSGPFTLFLMAACVVLSVLVVLLAVQNLRLKSALAERPGIPEDALEVGDPLGGMALRDGSGEVFPLAFDQGERRTLLLVFSVHCSACEQTFPLWKNLLAEVGTPAGLRVLGVQTDLPAGPEADPGSVPLASFPFDVYGVDYDGSEAMSHIPGVPATILVDREGTVERVWFGVLRDDQLAELRRTLEG